MHEGKPQTRTHAAWDMRASSIADDDVTFQTRNVGSVDESPKALDGGLPVLNISSALA